MSKSTSSIHGLVLLLSAALLLIMVGCAPNSSADATRSIQAGDTDLTCPDAANLHFEPGLSPQTQPQKITGTLRIGTESSPATPCSSLSGVPYKGAVGVIEGTGDLGCTATSLTGGAQGTVDITWDNGDTSVVEWEATTYGAAPVLTATFTEGALEGSTIVQEGLPTGISGTCVLNPITSGGFSGTAHAVDAG